MTRMEQVGLGKYPRYPCNPWLNFFQSFLITFAATRTV
jgi:hypothetical protein